MSKNKTLNKAKKEKNDEFYTQLSDIENELKHYKEHFKDKIIFCNCDDPEWSNFWKYFELCFEHLGLKKLISTHYEESKPSYKLELEKVNGKLIKTKANLNQNGDFRSQECIDILKEADIVVTNPPFSLFREYIAQLIEYDKKFLIIGNQGAVTYKEIFPLIKENKVWFGVNSGAKEYRIPETYTHLKYEERNGERFTKLGNTCWFTNLDHEIRHEKIILYKSYEEEKEIFRKYDNYKAINVDKSKHVPKDYYGVMGVPITFLDKFCPEQFEIVGIDFQVKDGILSYLKEENWDGKLDKGYIDGKRLYARIFIKRNDV